MSFEPTCSSSLNLRFWDRILTWLAIKDEGRLTFRRTVTFPRRYRSKGTPAYHVRDDTRGGLPPCVLSQRSCLWAESPARCGSDDMSPQDMLRPARWRRGEGCEASLVEQHLFV